MQDVTLAAASRLGAGGWEMPSRRARRIPRCSRNSRLLGADGFEPVQACPAGDRRAIRSLCSISPVPVSHSIIQWPTFSNCSEAVRSCTKIREPFGRGGAELAGGKTTQQPLPLLTAFPTALLAPLLEPRPKPLPAFLLVPLLHSLRQHRWHLLEPLYTRKVQSLRPRLCVNLPRHHHRPDPCSERPLELHLTRAPGNHPPAASWSRMISICPPRTPCCSVSRRICSWKA